MKNLPKFIYLQIGEDTEPTDDFNDLGEVTWCQDPIHQNDIPYIRIDEISSFIQKEHNHPPVASAPQADATQPEEA